MLTVNLYSPGFKICLVTMTGCYNVRQTIGEALLVDALSQQTRKQSISSTNHYNPLVVVRCIFELNLLG